MKRPLPATLQVLTPCCGGVASIAVYCGGVMGSYKCRRCHRWWHYESRVTVDWVPGEQYYGKREAKP